MIALCLYSYFKQTALKAALSVSPNKRLAYVTVIVTYLVMDPINVTPFIESFCRHMHLLTVFTDTNKDSIACTHACEIPTLFAETISLFFIYLLRVLDILLFCFLTRKQELLQTKKQIYLLNYLLCMFHFGKIISICNITFRFNKCLAF